MVVRSRFLYAAPYDGHTHDKHHQRLRRAGRALTVEAVQWIRQFVEAEGRDVQRVLEFLRAPRTTVPPVSFVEALPDKITVMGLAFETYVI